MILLSCRGLPEFDAVAFGVGDPGELSELSILAARVDAHALRGQPREDRVEVVHAVVEHERRRARIEVVRVLVEQRPDGGAGRIGIALAPSEEDRSVLRLEAEVCAVPLAELFW